VQQQPRHRRDSGVIPRPVTGNPVAGNPAPASPLRPTRSGSNAILWVVTSAVVSAVICAAIALIVIIPMILNRDDGESGAPAEAPAAQPAGTLPDGTGSLWSPPIEKTQEVAS
jgi:hypothetical protein